ncbi:uncharacterized protein LOC112006941 [Quercus suber]|uniref:uncharacterized protein LOC112006941 n=1 Tax=Quercus suber TaxID=58331 RepID=UPI0032DEF6FF
MAGRHSVSGAESGSTGSSQGSSWLERRQKRLEDRNRTREEKWSGLSEGSFQTQRTTSVASGHRLRDDRDEELERLRRLVRDLELEAENMHHRRARDDQRGRPDAGENNQGAGSNQSRSNHRHERSHSRESRRQREHSHSREYHSHQDHSRSRGYVDQGSGSPEERRPRNAAMDMMSRALRKAARSPFSAGIEQAPMPDRFVRPPFNSYDGKTDPVEHISHYIQMMFLHTHNDALMCKGFPSSLGPTALRWFNGLRKGSIHNFAELIQEFGVRFVTCSRVPQLVDALLSMKMRVGETLCSYAARYWELYNEIGGGNKKIIASTFRMGLPEDSDLQESLTKKPPEDMRQLMRRIEEYKRLEDDQLQSKGKAPVLNRPRQNVYTPRIRGNLRIQEPEAQVGKVNLAFREPVHRIVDKIKHEPYFRWPNKMGRDPSRRNQSLYCTYHKDKGHTTEQCRVLRDHLRQLVKAGHLKEFVMDRGDRGAGQGAPQRGNLLPPPLGIIEVIHIAPRGLTITGGNGMLTVASIGGSPVTPPAKRIKPTQELIAFDDSDLEGTMQPHDDALVVTACVGGFIMKRIMIDQGSGAEVMYLDLFRGLGLKNENLSKYSTPLVGFDGKVVVPEGQISLLVNMEGKEVVVKFIVVASFSPYTAILGRLWIHAMAAVPSTLHMKVKFPTDHGITVVRGSQWAAKQCLVAVVNCKKEQTNQKEKAESNGPLSGKPL